MSQVLSDDQLALLKKDWVSGLLSVRFLRIKHGLPDESVVERLAVEHGWPPRNIKAVIQEETHRALVDRVASDASPNDPNTVVDPSESVALYAQQAATVVETHKSSANKARGLADQMLDELVAIQPPKVDENAIKTLASAVMKHNPALAHHLLEHVGPTSPAQKMTFLTRRIGMLRSLSETHERYIALERQAWGLDEKETGQLEFDQVLAALDARR